MAEISIIVPVYRVEKYLARCIDSIMTQTYTDFELILVDDGSPDQCGVICEEYAENDNRIHVIHQTNGGLSAARNTAIDWVNHNSKSRYLTFVDSDDWIHPQYLEILHDAAEKENVDVAVAGHRRTVQYQTVLESEYYRSFHQQIQVISAEDLLTEHEWNFNYACGKLYRRECFGDIRYPVGKLYEDTFTTYKILFAAGKLAFIEAELYYYFVNNEGISRSPWKPSELAVMDGIREQITFYRQNNFKRALEKEEWLYLNHHAYQISRIRDSLLSEKEKKYYISELKKNMLCLMRDNRKKYNIHTMQQCYEAAWPRLMKMYHMAGTTVRKLSKNRG